MSVQLCLVVPFQLLYCNHPLLLVHEYHWYVRFLHQMLYFRMHSHLVHVLALLPIIRRLSQMSAKESLSFSVVFVIASSYCSLHLIISSLYFFHCLYVTAFKIHRNIIIYIIIYYHIFSNCIIIILYL